MSVVISDLKEQIVLTRAVAKPGMVVGTKKYLKKKYCKHCAEYIEFDEVRIGNHGYQYHDITKGGCGQRIRTKPRLGHLKKKYWTGKRI